jgi:hypothetical protein
MKRVEQYRRHAEECRTLAKRSLWPEERDILLNMAESWETLATARVAQIIEERRTKRDIATDPEWDK